MNEPQTDTPKTYAEINWASEYDPDCEVVSAELSSKLEKELAAVTEQRDEALSDLEFRRDLFVLQEQQLNDVRAERDRLAEALRKAISWGDSASHHILYRQNINWTYLNEAREALQSLTTKSQAQPPKVG